MKRLLYLLAALAVFWSATVASAIILIRAPVPASAPATAYSEEVLADSPVGYWRLGETSGTNANDEGSASIDGTYSGTYTQNQTSLLTSDTANKSVLLDGSSGYIDMTNDVAFRFSGAFTIECLVKFSSFPSSGNQAWLIGKAYDSGANRTSYCLYVAVSGGGATKTLVVENYDGSANNGTSYDVSSWSTGTTYHVAGGYTGSAWKLYVDGSEVASTTSGSGPQNANRALNVGRESNSFENKNYLHGTIDEVAVYGSWLGSRITAHNAAR